MFFRILKQPSSFLYGGRITTFCHKQFMRKYASNLKKKYTATLNLPTTKFPLSLKNGVAVEREKRIQKSCDFKGLYGWQEKQDRKNTFVLHDGPPYANGETHVGHALNKILKDITNRFKVLDGYKVHYIPGWDCHGMPIEQKALATVKESYRSMNPLDIRKKAQLFAKTTIKNQRKSFVEWGVMADWDNKCYFTFDKDYEHKQLDVFYKMYKSGHIYQEYMPVYWSPSSGTALAESELEYKSDHVSTSVFVKFAVREIPNILGQFTMNCPCYILIWTTTPWTLPSNQAVCYSSGIKYSIVKSQSSQEVFIVASEFIPQLENMLGQKLELLKEVQGQELQSMTYSHPLNSDVVCPVLPANHVTIEKGTGLVHTAPAHGQEDFHVAVNNKLPVLCHVDEDGKFMNELGPHLSGKNVLTDGNQAVLDLLKDQILCKEAFTHSYPYDWRSKEPVILRASKQWFVDTGKIKEAAVKCLEGVRVIPKASESGMLSQLSARTYWCISRQRYWGVPIPVFYSKRNGEALLNDFTLEHLKSLVKKYGTDCWWQLNIDDLLPPNVKEQCGLPADEEFIKGSDVLDIWFDSGISWSNVLQGSDGCCDVYMEGVDQFGGWFQSSLLTSVAAQQKAPYKSLVVHGFAVDEEGKKMSKSLGNVVSPHTVIHGGKDPATQPSYGVDVLRLWAAQPGLHTTVNIGPNSLDQCQQLLFRFRKSLRYLMGNLFDFESSQSTHNLPYESLLPQDKYMLHLLHQFLTQVKLAYEDYNFTKVLQLCEKFNNVHMSGFFGHITKNRLYCFNKDDPRRRSAQTVQFHLLDSMIKSLAPIVPHFSEELYQYHPFKDSTPSVFKTSWPEPSQDWQNEAWNQTFDAAFSIRDTFYKTIGSEHPTEFDLVICAKPALFKELKKLHEDGLTSSLSPLCEILQCSSLSLLSRPPLVIPDDSQPVEGSCSLTLESGEVMEKVKYLVVIMSADNHICERCRRYTAEIYGQPCANCSEAMAEGWQ